MRRLQLMFWCLFPFSVVCSQETCRVLLPNIALKYEGMCKKGKAEGTGKASD